MFGPFKMSCIALALFTLFARNASGEVLDCAPYRVGGTIDSELQVSTFHRRGKISEPRWMELRWPRGARILGAPELREDGRKVETDRGMGFEFDLDTGHPKFGWTEIPRVVYISVRGVDYLPVRTVLGRYGNMKSAKRVLKYRPDGTTYYPSDGYFFTGDGLPGGWREIEYPPELRAWDPQSQTYARWEGEEVVAALVCARVEDYPNPNCRMTVKEEPIFAEIFFNRRLLGDLALLEKRAREFALCLMEIEK